MKREMGKSTILFSYRASEIAYDEIDLAFSLKALPSSSLDEAARKLKAWEERLGSLTGLEPEISLSIGISIREGRKN